MATYITVDDVVFSEGDTTAVFNVRIHSDGAPAATPFDIIYSGFDGVSIGGVNFSLPDSLLTINSGVSTATIAVQLPSDATVGTLFAGFQLQLSTGAADVFFSNNLVTATLVEADTAPVALPVLTPGDVVVDESAGIATVYVTLDAPSASAITVAYTTQNANATAGSDYTATSDTLTIAAGATVGKIEIPITADGDIEGRELISVILSSPSGATLGDDLVHVIIQDSSAALDPSPTINVQDVTVGENQGYVDFIVTLSAPSASNVTVQYSTADGTAFALDALALATNDYVGVTAAELTFAPGEVSKVVRILVNDNAAVDAAVLRDFTLNLSAAGGGVIGTGTATARLIDNEATVTSITHTASANGDILAGTVYGDSMLGGSGDDVLDGRASSDTMRGGAGNDIYVIEQDGGDVSEFVGFTAVDAGGNDTIITYRSNTTVSTNVETMILAGTAAMADGFSYGYGNASDNHIVGNSLRNWITGVAGNDTLDGGVGNDTMYGGTGDDTYHVDNAGDAPCEYVGEGTDTVISSVDHRLGQNLTPDNVGVLDFLENLVLTGTANLTGTGNSLANQITGNTGNNRLDGAGGIDTLIGGLGDDTYVVDNTADVITENAGEGTETVEASASYTLGAELENLTLTGTGNIDGTGNTGANTITGNSGNNRLDGGAGADALIGGAGNDTYVYDALDTITELVGGGSDTLEIGQTYTVGTLGISGVENVTLTGITDIDATGDANANVLTGNAGFNDLIGLGGNDTLDGLGGADNLVGGEGDDSYVFDAADTITELANQGSDTILTAASHVLATANVENVTLTGSANVDATGDAAANRLTGNSGNNRLDGAVGVDTLVGGAGNDTYVYDAADTITEGAGEGSDTIEAGVTYTLAVANVENVTLTGTGNINATGDAAANALTGNSGNNVLNGAAGADTMTGGAGDDSYVVADAGDVVVEGVGAGTDSVSASVTYTLTANVENLTLAGTGAISGTGNVLNNAITGNAGNNVLNGGAGDDVLTGAGGNDSYYVDSALDNVVEGLAAGSDTVYASVGYTLTSNVETLVLLGSAGLSATGNALANSITGNAGNNALDGGAGNDTIRGGGGADTMTGGLGNDVFVVDSIDDQVVELDAGGTDLVSSSITYQLGNFVENLTLAGATNLNGTGNGLNNFLTGNTGNNSLTGGVGNDTLSGAAGVDTLIGGVGDDAYIVDSTTDTVTEVAGQGTDTVHSSVTYTLGSELENLTLTGAAAISGTGNGLNNVLTGNAAANGLSGGAGNDVFIGGAGNDSMTGGIGNDSYYVDAAGDVIVELAGEGSETVYSSANYTLAANVESLVLQGVAGLSGTGNASANAITGNAGANVLNGAGGDDTIRGGGGADTMGGGLGNDVFVVDSLDDVTSEAAGEGTDLVVTGLTMTLQANVENLTLNGTANVNGTGNTGNNLLTGNTGNNVLTGGAGLDTLVGAAGLDTLIGGTGDDTYVMDGVTDVITELAGEGADTVQSSVTFTLGANLEHLTLTGAGAINGTGNAANNILTGNGAANTLTGGEGQDQLSGGAGNDTAIGGLGADVYLVDSSNDVVVEAVGEGDDTVLTSASYTLSANVENLILNGATNFNGNGNAGANAITGNTGNNALSGGDGNDTLRGGGGIDTLTGGLGNDVMVIDSADDVVVEVAGGGTDTVVSSISYTLANEVENLTLSGTAAINATGNTVANFLTGNSGDNTLTGGLGNDTLVGGAGADQFVFNTALNGTTNVDRMTDFNTVDQFMLDNDVFTALGAAGALDASRFVSGAGVTGATLAGQLAGIYHDTTGGGLYYDADGVGGAAGVRFASLNGGLALNSLEFTVIE